MSTVVRTESPSPYCAAPNQTPKPPQDLMTRLCAPFPGDRIHWKPQTISKDQTKAMAVPYLDARDVAQRLDEVRGPGGWQVDHKAVGNQTMTGIGLKIDGEWIFKWDVGFIATRGDEAMSVKGSVSDGVKRAGVLWGVGRYLARIPKQWLGWDPERKRFTETPKLPAWAVPNGTSR